MRCTARIFPVTLVKHQSASPLWRRERERERGGEKSVNRSAHSTNQRTLFPEIPLFTKVPKVVECCKYLQRFPPSVLSTTGLWARGGEATDTACSGGLEGGGHRYGPFSVTHPVLNCTVFLAKLYVGGYEYLYISSVVYRDTVFLAKLYIASYEYLYISS